MRHCRPVPGLRASCYDRKRQAREAPGTGIPFPTEGSHPMIGFPYNNTNYYLIPSTNGGLLAFDAGWPCSLYDYARAMKPTGHGLAEIGWAVVSHFHIDHAGLIGEFQRRGIPCLVFENQPDAIDAMEELISRKYSGYATIRKEELVRVATRDSRAFFAELGIGAEVIPTPGHSEDSVSLITDVGEALVGDLPPPFQVMEDDLPCLASWKLIGDRGGRSVFPSHARPFDLA